MRKPAGRPAQVTVDQRRRTRARNNIASAWKETTLTTADKAVSGFILLAIVILGLACTVLILMHIVS